MSAGVALEGACPARRRRRGGELALAVAVLIASGIPDASSAQPAVRSAHLSADIGPEGEAAVSVEYVLSGVRGLGEVEVALLGFDVATTETLRLPDGRALDLAPVSGSRRRATLALDGSDHARVALTYRIETATRFDGGALRARIPVATVSLPSAADSGDVFHARIRVPTDWVVVEGFPTGLIEVEPDVFMTDLPVVPSMVSLRGRSDGAWRPGVKLLIDLLTLAILLVVGAVGWRHLREVAA